MKRTLFSALALILAGATPAWAHPGHGLELTPAGILHWITHPDHAFTLILVVSVLGIAVGAVAYRVKKSEF
ncbi:MAG: hypothetical protein ACE5GJ_08965 [Gemmatimonadota bacterium]